MWLTCVSNSVWCICSPLLKLTLHWALFQVGNLKNIRLLWIWVNTWENKMTLTTWGECNVCTSLTRVSFSVWCICSPLRKLTSNHKERNSQAQQLLTITVYKIDVMLELFSDWRFFKFKFMKWTKGCTETTLCYHFHSTHTSSDNFLINE